jgi:hypothetical protein
VHVPIGTSLPNISARLLKNIQVAGDMIPGRLPKHRGVSKEKIGTNLLSFALWIPYNPPYSLKCYDTAIDDAVPEVFGAKLAR